MLMPHMTSSWPSSSSLTRSRCDPGLPGCSLPSLPRALLSLPESPLAGLCLGESDSSLASCVAPAPPMPQGERPGLPSRSSCPRPLTSASWLRWEKERCRRAEGGRRGLECEAVEECRSLLIARRREEGGERRGEREERKVAGGGERGEEGVGKEVY